MFEMGGHKLYGFGFVLSCLLAILAYYITTQHLLSGPALIAAICGLGTIQAMAQFVFFLHLTKETKPRWNLILFLFMVFVVAIVVIGSLWIMYNLDYRMMTPSDRGFG